MESLLVCRRCGRVYSAAFAAAHVAQDILAENKPARAKEARTQYSYYCGCGEVVYRVCDAAPTDPAVKAVVVVPGVGEGPGFAAVAEHAALPFPPFME